MEDDVLLRCIEANLLSDMSLQGIEAIAKVINSCLMLGNFVYFFFNPSLVLVQPRKTRPCITERLLMGRKESNQTKNQTKTFCRLLIFFFKIFKKKIEQYHQCQTI